MERPVAGIGDAPQLAAGTEDTDELCSLPTVQLNLGCFNCGIDQHMLPLSKHQDNLKRVIGKAVSDENLHLVTLCEVGGAQKMTGEDKCKRSRPHPRSAT